MGSALVGCTARFEMVTDTWCCFPKAKIHIPKTIGGRAGSFLLLPIMTMRSASHPQLSGFIVRFSFLDRNAKSQLSSRQALQNCRASGKG